MAEGEGTRIAKLLARAGVASRRDAEAMIASGRVAVNGKRIDTPALTVGPRDRITVDGQPLPQPEAPRLWLYHKPAGLVTTARDEQGRPTVFDQLPPDLPRVMSVGRLDLTSEGLLLLTNDGEIKRRLELPSTGWLRRYRVRVKGTPEEAMLAPLRDGITVDGERFQPMEVRLDRQQGANAWLTVGIREGKNREIRRAMEAVGLIVNRLIRVGYGPFKLGDLAPGAVEEVRPRVLRDQLGLAPPDPVAEGGADRTGRAGGPRRAGTAAGAGRDSGPGRPGRAPRAGAGAPRPDRERPGRAKGGKGPSARRQGAAGPRDGRQAEDRAARPVRAPEATREISDGRPAGAARGSRAKAPRPRQSRRTGEADRPATGTRPPRASEAPRKGTSDRPAAGGRAGAGPRPAKPGARPAASGARGGRHVRTDAPGAVPGRGAGGTERPRKPRGHKPGGATGAGPERPGPPSGASGGRPGADSGRPDRAGGGRRPVRPPASGGAGGRASDRSKDRVRDRAKDRAQDRAKDRAKDRPTPAGAAGGTVSRVTTTANSFRPAQKPRGAARPEAAGPAPADRAAAARDPSQRLDGRPRRPRTPAGPRKPGSGAKPPKR